MAKTKKVIGAGLILGIAVFILAGCVPEDMYGDNPFLGYQGYPQPAYYNNYYVYQPPVVYNQYAYRGHPNYWRRYQRRQVFWNYRRNQRWYRNNRQRGWYRHNGRGAVWGNRGGRRFFRTRAGGPRAAQFRRTRFHRSFSQGPRFNRSGGTHFRSRGGGSHGGGGGGGGHTGRRWQRP